MSFENITKGEWIVRQVNPYSVYNLCIEDMGLDSITNTEAEENRQLIEFCGNLQQKLDIGCFEEAVKMIETLVDEFETEVGKPLWIGDEARLLLDKINKQ
jgi:hypothetical protein